MKRIVVFVLILNSCFLYGQVDNTPTPIQFSAKSGSLTKAIGWGYRSTADEWVDYSNVICNRNDYKKKYRSMMNSDYMYSEYEQNFDSIVTKSLVIDSVTYYALIVHKTSGQYKYPNMKIDWYHYKETFGYIFSEDEFSKLDSITEEVTLSTKHRVSMGSVRIKYNEGIFLDSIKNELKQEKNEKATEYIFPVTLSEKGTIRFLTPEAFTEKNKYDFKEKYFEATYESFGKLLIKQ